MHLQYHSNTNNSTENLPQHKLATDNADIYNYYKKNIFHFITRRTEHKYNDTTRRPRRRRRKKKTFTRRNRQSQPGNSYWAQNCVIGRLQKSSKSGSNIITSSLYLEPQRGSIFYSFFNGRSLFCAGMKSFKQEVAISMYVPSTNTCVPDENISAIEPANSDRVFIEFGIGPANYVMGRSCSHTPACILILTKYFAWVKFLNLFA